MRGDFIYNKLLKNQKVDLKITLSNERDETHIN